jgi:hypothetical protein
MTSRFPIKGIIITALAISVVACSTAPTQSIKVGEGDAVLSICRPASYKRPVDKPDIYVQGNYVTELKSGSSFELAVSKGDQYSIVLGKKPLMYRFIDETLIEGAVSDNHVYVVVTPQANLMQGVTVFLGGAIAESVRQDGTTESGGWASAVVDSQSYESICQ